MTLRLRNTGADERHQTWTKVIERIYREQRDQAWSHYMFRLLRAVFVTNQKLSDEGGFILNWIAENYVHSTLMLLRRELDQQAGAENLRNLLLDIIEHPNVLTRARYRSNWGEQDQCEQARADGAFDKFKPKRVDGDPEADHIDPGVVRADLDRMVWSTERLRGYAERTRAHRTPERNINTSDLTFKAMHRTIADVRNVVRKYYALLTVRSIGQWEPVPQYDTIRPFMKRWVADREAVAEAAKQEADE